jgi:hypothetical protein
LNTISEQNCIKVLAPLNAQIRVTFQSKTITREQDVELVLGGIKKGMERK